MKTVKEVSRLTGVSIRTLHHYDALGLLRPTATTASGYRLYDDTALEWLQTILLFRALRFPLKEIREILDSPGFDRGLALAQQIHLLELQKEQIERLLDLARAIQSTGGDPLNFTAFDTSELEAYTARAKAAWGHTAAWGQYEERTQNRSRAEQLQMGAALMEVFRSLGAVRDGSPDSPAAQALVERLRDTITENWYPCTPEILAALGRMYTEDDGMRRSIDRAGGEGTAAFVRAAIEVRCQNA